MKETTQVVLPNGLQSIRTDTVYKLLSPCVAPNRRRRTNSWFKRIISHVFIWLPCLRGQDRSEMKLKGIAFLQRWTITVINRKMIQQHELGFCGLVTMVSADQRRLGLQINKVCGWNPQPFSLCFMAEQLDSAIPLTPTIMTVARNFSWYHFNHRVRHFSPFKCVEA